MCLVALSSLTLVGCCRYRRTLINEAVRYRQLNQCDAVKMAATSMQLLVNESSVLAMLTGLKKSKGVARHELEGALELQPLTKEEVQGNGTQDGRPSKIQRLNPSHHTTYCELLPPRPLTTSTT